MNTINDKLEDRRRTRIRLLWLTAALLIVALIVSWFRDPDAFALFTGSLNVSSTPQGAEVFIDGKSVGVTPLRIARLPEGRKTLLLTHRFHRNLVEQIDIVRGEELVVERDLPQATGSLSIVSNPTGGSIELDGEALTATTPLDLADVPAGTHQVRVGYSNHRTMTQDVDVLPDENTRVVMDLILVPWGTLTVKTVPAGATVTLIGVDEVYEPGMDLPLGDYAIEVKKAGYPSVSQRVRVGMGDNTHTVTLRRLEVPLQVDVVPADAQITLEYQLDGLTRVRPYASRINVPMGNVTVLARATGYRTERKSVTLGEEGARLQMRLKKFSVAAGESFRDKLRSGGEGPRLTVVGPGSFRMGDITGIGARDEQPVHEVHLTQPFAVGVYETSAAEFARYQRAVGADASSNEENPELPAVNISFKEAQDYLRWLSNETGYQYRLPSEAEWEYFARAGVETPYVMGATPETVCDYANIADQSTRQVFREWDVAKCTDGFARIAPVGRLKPNGFGLFDVSGNVTEWVADCWSENYELARDDELPYQEGQSCNRVFRGGSWDSQPETVRLSYRQSSDRANDDRGLRVVREL